MARTTLTSASPPAKRPQPPPQLPLAAFQTSPATSKVVGVVVNAAGGYSRGVLRGVSSFAAARAWTLRVVGVNEASIDTEGQSWHGALVQAATIEQARMYARLPFPVINISSAVKDSGLPTVITDDVLVGRLGADHFLRLGYRTLIFFGPDPRAFSKSRHQGFEARASEAGVKIQLVAQESDLEHALKERVAGMGPLAVMGCNDRSALAALDVCRKLQLRVPDDIAVLGVDDDDLVQSLAYLPLSTVNTARDRVGFEAAALLDQLMTAKTSRHTSPTSNASPALSATITLVGPKGITARRSTDSIATSDTDVADAARFIHAHAGRPISVNDVAKASTVSRRQLERRFKTSLGRSILDEIVKCRIDRARQLLMDTDLTLEQVAFASGFASGSYFSVVFKRHTKATPQRFRDGYRTGK